MLAAAQFVFALAFSPPVVAAEAPAVPQIITDTEREYGLLREAVKVRTDAVEAAITRASKAGTLKISTEAYFREVLEAFRPTASGQPDTTRLYYPPRFDASEEMEPINKAFADLKVEMAHVQDTATRQSGRLQEAAVEAVQLVARTAETPEQLAEAETLVLALGKFPDVSRTRFGSPSSMAVDEALAKVLAALRAALEASGKHDVGALIAALQRFPTSPGGLSQMRFRELPFPMEAFWDQVRQRLAKTFTDAAREAQAAVEKALIADKSAGEVERLIAEYEARSAGVEKLTTDQERPGYFRGSPQMNEGRNAVVKNYRAILAAVAELKREDLDASWQNNSSPALLSDAPNGVTDEFRNFVVELSIKRPQHRHEVQAAAEKKKRDEQVAAEKQREADERDRVAKELAETAEQTRQITAALREKILALPTPAAAMELAEELPRMYGGLRSQRNGEEPMDWRSLQRELRSLAAWWADPSGQRGESQAAEFNGAGASSVVMELRKLRERVTRETVAERLGAPELRQPPLAELPVNAAVGKLADAAAGRSDWKRAYELVQATDSAVGTRGVMAVPNARLQAIHAYLSGQNLEKAEQFREAIAAYQLVLQNVTDRVPTQEATDRLKALKKAHPESFSAAPVKASATSPTSRVGGFPQN